MSSESANTRSVQAESPRWEQGSLFSGVLEPGSTAANEALYSAANGSHAPVAGGVAQRVQPGERHLRAARRLSREIRAQRRSRRARTATGLAICGHLLALLDADTNIDGDHNSARGTLSKV